MRAETTSRQGSPYAVHRFEEQYREWYQPVVALCRRCLGDEADAEAVAQDAFFKAWMADDAFTKDRPFGPWIFTIARRLCLNELKSRTRRRQNVVGIASLVGPAPSTDVELDRTLTTESVVQTLQHLSPRYRRLLELRERDGWSYEEISRIEGVSLESVRAGLKRARDAFRHAYQSTTGAGWSAVAFGVRVLRAVRDRVGRVRSGAEVSSGWVIDRFAAVDWATMFVALLLVTTPFGNGVASSRPMDPVDVAAAPTTSTVNAPGGNLPSTGRRPNAGVDRRSVDDAPSSPAPAASSGPGTGDGMYYEFTASPSYEQDQTVFANGTARECTGRTSCNLLFKSADGGATWELLPAVGVDRGPLLLPPSYPRDNRLFSVSGNRLSVSKDGGATFQIASLATGPAAMSPLFSDGDPRILFGLGPSRSSLAVPFATEYRDGTPAVAPLELPLPTGASPGFVAFGPTYKADRRMLVVADELVQQSSFVPFNPTTKLYSCTTEACDELVTLGIGPSVPPVVSVSGPRNTVVVWTPWKLVRSRDGGRSFQQVPALPGTAAHRMLTHVAGGPDGSLFATVVDSYSPGMNAQLHVSHDDGDTWTMLHGTTGPYTGLIALPDGVLLGAPPWNLGGSISRSLDGGRTWHTV